MIGVFRLKLQATENIDRNWNSDIELFPEEAQVLERTIEELIENLVYVIKGHRQRFPHGKPNLKSVLR